MPIRLINMAIVAVTTLSLIGMTNSALAKGSRGGYRSSGGKSVHVRGYFRSNGTYVHSYTRGGGSYSGLSNSNIWKNKKYGNVGTSYTPQPLTSNYSSSSIPLDAPSYVSYVQPDWCNKATTEAENLVCKNQGLSASAIQLDDVWDDYQVLHLPKDISAKRTYLTDWNRNTFQVCKKPDCISLAHKQAIAELQKDNQFPAKLRTPYPFLGVKSFKVSGITDAKILISPTGNSKIKIYYAGLPQTEFEGKYKPPIKVDFSKSYVIRGNKIYILSYGETIQSCEQNEYFKDNCSSTLN